MSEQTKNKPATAKQIAYIKRLQKEIGSEEKAIKGKISSFDASEIIGKLIVKVHQRGVRNSGTKKIQINEPRLGMAMKECFKVRINHGWDIYNRHREDFIDEVISTYDLFTEIAEKLANSVIGTTESLAAKGGTSPTLSTPASPERTGSVI